MQQTGACYTVGAIMSRNGRHTALIRLKRGGKIVHQESKTFDSKRDAQNWMRRRELEVADQLTAVKPNDPPLAEVIERYLSDTHKPVGKTKRQVLTTIKRHQLAALPCSQIDSAALVDFAQSLDSLPQTRNNYLSHLSALFAIAEPAWGYPLEHAAIVKAKAVCARLGLTAKPNKRTRRPTLPELEAILDWFAGSSGVIPMVDMTLFALFSARRQEEVTRLRWADFNERTHTVIVRDMKNPGQKKGNDVECLLPDEAMAVVLKQPRVDALIFPYNGRSVSANFTRATRRLGIEDLHFHDLRHEGVTRLFEMGWDIPRVASVSGHRTWTSLQRYTHIKRVGDKYAGWQWTPDTSGISSVDAYPR